MTKQMNYAQLAASVITKCCAYDPTLSDPTEEQSLAWAEQLERYQLNDLDVLMAAVAEAYAQNGHGFRPLPKDITDAARRLRDERAKRGTAAEVRAVAPSPASDEARRRAIETFCRTTGRPQRDADAIAAAPAVAEAVQHAVEHLTKPADPVEVAAEAERLGFPQEYVREIAQGRR